jgi:hypothetical protein
MVENEKRTVSIEKCKQARFNGNVLLNKDGKVNPFPYLFRSSFNVGHSDDVPSIHFLKNPPIFECIDRSRDFLRVTFENPDVLESI